MPTYEYACDSCLVIYKSMHRMSEAGPTTCRNCKGELRKVISAPSFNSGNHTSPTAAKYSKMSNSEEIAREHELQKVYKSIWMPEEVKHSPWEEDDHDR
ncbi:MAG: zinc ribbon domain-containing protein [Proteobacteria bacterium]|nr:zinc ribbon domain-containing protein [Pseudomonadota bacterium]MDA1331803.1 zinc ribbon domain-containing protein [Pseudomonadota bacterium]